MCFFVGREKKSKRGRRHRDGISYVIENLTANGKRGAGIRQAESCMFRDRLRDLFRSLQ